jgi:integrase/recombinase XerD
MSNFPCLVRVVSGSGQVRYRLGERLVDRYLEFVAGRCRPNTLRAVAFDLKAFFKVVGKGPVEVTAADVFEFLAHQRGDRSVIRLADQESGLSARTIARRLSSVSGLYAYLVARGDTPVQVNPVPRVLLTRRQGGTRRSRTVPLVRVPRTLPRILPPEETDRLVAALRTHRDRAMVLAMLLAGLRRCEVLGLRFCDVQVADRRLAVVEGKGGHHRVVPAANRFFAALGAYLHDERPAAAATDRVFVVLKGPRRGMPLSSEGLDEILDGARRRAGLEHATCHQLRHTCRAGCNAGHAALRRISAHQPGRALRRAVCKERLVREGKAHAALVFDGDLAVAWCQFGAIAGRARRDRSDRAAPGGAVVAGVSPHFRLRPPCPTDGGDSLARVADGRCYSMQGVGPAGEESAR